MTDNPADEIQDGAVSDSLSMWDFLKSRKQQANIPALKDAVYTLIKMTMQKDAGQRTDNVGRSVPFQIIDMIKWVIICESVALVLSGRLDEIEKS